MKLLFAVLNLSCPLESSKDVILLCAMRWIYQLLVYANVFLFSTLLKCVVH